MCHITHSFSRYAYFKKLDYFSTECIYSPDAYRGHARAFLKDLEAARPSAIIDIIHSGEAFEVREEIRATQKVQRKLHTILFFFLPFYIFYSVLAYLLKKKTISYHRNMPAMWVHVKQRPM